MAVIDISCLSPSLLHCDLSTAEVEELKAALLLLLLLLL